MTDLKTAMTPTKAAPPPAPEKSWQWDGTTNPIDWPSWVVKHGAIIDAGALRLNAGNGMMITATQREWIVEDSKGAVRVTKDEPKH